MVCGDSNCGFDFPFQYFMCSPAGCIGLISIKKQIERDEEIAEELQDRNKSDRGAESQDS